MRRVEGFGVSVGVWGFGDQIGRGALWRLWWLGSAVLGEGAGRAGFGLDSRLLRRGPVDTRDENSFVFLF